MAEASPPPRSVAAFERLLIRARRSQEFAEHQVWGRKVAPELAASRPEAVVLTIDEIRAANDILKNAIVRHNRESGEHITFMSYEDFEGRYGNPTDGVWPTIAEQSRVVVMWCESALTILVSIGDAGPSQVSHHYGDVINMRDQFNVLKAAQVGPNNKGQVMYNEVEHQGIDPADLPALLEALAKLRSAMRSEAADTEHDLAVAEIARAETAARKGDLQSARQYFAAAGTWALDVATKIGVGVAIAALTNGSK